MRKQRYIPFGYQFELGEYQPHYIKEGLKWLQNKLRRAEAESTAEDIDND